MIAARLNTLADIYKICTQPRNDYRQALRIGGHGDNNKKRLQTGSPERPVKFFTAMQEVGSIDGYLVTLLTGRGSSGTAACEACMRAGR